MNDDNIAAARGLQVEVLMELILNKISVDTL